MPITAKIEQNVPPAQYVSIHNWFDQFPIILEQDNGDIILFTAASLNVCSYTYLYCGASNSDVSKYMQRGYTKIVPPHWLFKKFIGSIRLTQDF